jgi:Predicted acetyltransferases and hydrolases with the alpha/beta hydrolase fold
MALSLKIYRKSSEKIAKNLIILIHGLGAPETTWISENISWKDLLMSDLRFDDVDVGIVKYDTAHVALGILKKAGIKSINTGIFDKISVDKGPFTDIKTLAHELKRELNLEKSKNYGRIIIVGHSMGGLIGIRYILEEIEHNEVLKVNGFISLATPYNGSNKAFYNSLFGSIHKHAQIPSLEPNSIFLDDTIRLWEKHKENIKFDCIFCYAINDEWVPLESSLPHIVSSKWKHSIPIPGNHSSILNVENHESLPYVVVSESIQNIISEENELEEKKNEQKALEKSKKAINIIEGDITSYNVSEKENCRLETEIHTVNIEEILSKVKESYEFRFYIQATDIMPIEEIAKVILSINNEEKLKSILEKVYKILSIRKDVEDKSGVTMRFWTYIIHGIEEKSKKDVLSEFVKKDIYIMVYFVSLFPSVWEYVKKDYRYMRGLWKEDKEFIVLCYDHSCVNDRERAWNVVKMMLDEGVVPKQEEDDFVNHFAYNKYCNPLEFIVPTLKKTRYFELLKDHIFAYRNFNRSGDGINSANDNAKKIKLYLENVELEEAVVKIVDDLYSFVSYGKFKDSIEELMNNADFKERYYNLLKYIS